MCDGDEFHIYISGLCDTALMVLTSEMIKKSAYSADAYDPVHWKCDECHNESVRRNKLNIYKSAYYLAFPRSP